MPELPEVETVRRGLAAGLVGRTLGPATVTHGRAVRRQAGGAAQFIAATADLRVSGVHRRGKYLWLSFEGSEHVMVAHLGMSGQFRILAPADPAPAGDPHARVWWPFWTAVGNRQGSARAQDAGTLVFRDQRTFGWVLADHLRDDTPAVVSHIGLDPFDPLFDAATAVRSMRRSSSGIKRVLLAQRSVSGIGNIYADEALWRARVHPEHPARRLSSGRAHLVLASATQVMSEALAAGGTSFDPLYVAVNGESGWFDRDLDVYGQQGHPCPRCGTPIIRERFTNRSSHRCPRCQPAPRRGTSAPA